MMNARGTSRRLLQRPSDPTDCRPNEPTIGKRTKRSDRLSTNRADRRPNVCGGPTGRFPYQKRKPAHSCARQATPALSRCSLQHRLHAPNVQNFFRSLSGQKGQAFIGSRLDTTSTPIARLRCFSWQKLNLSRSLVTPRCATPRPPAPADHALASGAAVRSVPDPRMSRQIKWCTKQHRVYVKTNYIS